MGNVIKVIFQNVRYLPSIIMKLHNWPFFLVAYMKLYKKSGVFSFRNGKKLYFNQAIAAGAVMVVDIRKHYGEIGNDETVIFDVGANIGTFSLYAYGNNKHRKIYSFEPNQANYQVLVKNIELNNCSASVHPHMLGVASRSGCMDMMISEESPTHSMIVHQNVTNSVKIECTTIEDIMRRYGLEHIDFLKMNCEGSEYEIFYTMNQSTLKNIKKIRLEFHQIDESTMNGKHLSEFLASHGFSVDYYAQYNKDSGFIWASRIQ